MKRYALGALVCAGLFGAAGLTNLALAPPAHAQSGPPWTSSTTTFAQAVTQANGTQVQSVCTPAYWATIQSKFAGNPGAGSLGTLSSAGLIQNSQQFKTGYVQVHLHCTTPAGVEEFVAVTLKLTSGQWKVCGGWNPH